MQELTDSVKMFNEQPVEHSQERQEATDIKAEAKKEKTLSQSNSGSSINSEKNCPGENKENNNKNQKNSFVVKMEI